MVIARIREHVATHNWFAVLVDVAIVVLGVFLGTQVNNWNERRIEREQGHQYRLRLIDDLKANEKDLDDRKAYYLIVRDHARAALAALDRPADHRDAQLLIDAYEASQITPRKLKTFTYDELLAQGAMPWVGDARLREKIANYYVGVETTGNTFDAVPPYRENLRQVMPSAAQEAVRRDCPETIYFTKEGAGQAKLSENCHLLRLDAVTIARAAAAVRAVPSLKGDLFRWIADLDIKISLADAMMTHQQRLAGQIAAADKEE